MAETRQTILIMDTSTPSLRSGVEGWTYEDPRNVVPGHIGHTRSGMTGEHAYDCVLRALADGWRLLGPPSQEGDGWVWWLARDEEVPRG